MQTKFFRVIPIIPERLQPLQEIAYNLWWTWNPSAVDLFRCIDRNLWEETCHNAVLLLGRISQEMLKDLSEDRVFVSRMKHVYQGLRNYLDKPVWFDTYRENLLNTSEELCFASFSAEFGFHESIPIYSGGLGILAGDTLKSASELGVPLVGVSLLYRQGYFNQYVNSDGWQQEKYSLNDYSNMPVEQVAGSDGKLLTLSIPLLDSEVQYHVWKIKVGRTSLYLLDTNLPQNDQSAREITNNLYGGDKEMRIRQEIILGIGGIRALSAVGLTPTVTHLNEGHSAFLLVERILQLMRKGLDFPTAREMVSASSVFTTHTPVSAGNEEFHPELIIKYLKPFISETGLSDREFLSLGQLNGNHMFSLTVFSLRLTGFHNGVSQLHGSEARKMWKDVWPGLPESDVPISHITNGVHTGTWISDEISRLYDRYLGPRWPTNPLEERYWENIEQIPDSELWNSHERLRERLITYTRYKWMNQLSRWGIHLPGMDDFPILDSESLTLGFARRFSSYKRATLLFHDEERLFSLLNNRERPIQLIFSGKAHPHDDEGKELISRIIHLSLKKDFFGKLIYLEDYNMDIARHLVQGSDVWLNTPRRPLEASGTSGMKAAMNGVLNCSIPDGWWAEAYTPDVGWAIGQGEVYRDQDTQDNVEAKTLYERLEREIIPLFYDRGKDGFPVKWVALMKNSMRQISSRFNSNRMVTEYVGKFYLPALEKWNLLNRDDMSVAKEFAEWLGAIRKNWSSVEIIEIECPSEEVVKSVGDTFPVTVKVRSPIIKYDDMSVEVPFGLAGPEYQLTGGDITKLSFSHDEQDLLVFKGEINCSVSGRMGFTVRILPSHQTFGTIVESGLVTCWE